MLVGDRIYNIRTGEELGTICEITDRGTVFYRRKHNLGIIDNTNCHPLVKFGTIEAAIQIAERRLKDLKAVP